MKTFLHKLLSTASVFALVLMLVAPISVYADQKPTQVNLDATPAAIETFESLTLSAVVQGDPDQPEPSLSEAPEGSVTFYSNGEVIACFANTYTSDFNDQTKDGMRDYYWRATCDTEFISEGVYNITATFSGSSSTLASSSNPENSKIITVAGKNPAPTETFIDTDPNPSEPYENVTLYSTTYPTNRNVQLESAEGTVTFKYNGNAVSFSCQNIITTLENDDLGNNYLAASCTASASAVGNYALVSEYSGGANTEPSVSEGLNQEVSYATMTELTQDSSITQLGQKVTFIARVSVPSLEDDAVSQETESGTTNEFGTVNFTNGDTVLCADVPLTYVYDETTEFYDEYFICETTVLPSGAQTVTSKYSGSDGLRPSEATIQHTVVAPPATSPATTRTTPVPITIATVTNPEASTTFSDPNNDIFNGTATPPEVKAETTTPAQNGQTSSTNNENKKDTKTNTSSEDGFPWWIIFLILSLAAVYYAYVKRRAENN